MAEVHLVPVFLPVGGEAAPGTVCLPLAAVLGHPALEGLAGLPDVEGLLVVGTLTVNSVDEATQSGWLQPNLRAPQRLQ